ncbi:MAG: hypothetical protein KA313_04845 [Pseudarcicella sp.]|jgi:hypothetical protein|nr:hypothetical protein [Pseudarcicella sp.]MBP6410407.1 hypothetical protein [Pseudarcicella sp.]
MAFILVFYNVGEKCRRRVVSEDTDEGGGFSKTKLRKESNIVKSNSFKQKNKP